MSLLFIHIILGVMVCALTLVRLVAVVGFNKRFRGLAGSILAAGTMQAVSGAALLVYGASMAHICGAAVATMGFIGLAELAVRRHTAILGKSRL